ncbi:MAG: patatin-like phospholipase family protein [Pseudomonadota bacterium]
MIRGWPRALTLAGLILALPAPGLAAQEARPRIGLVLSGGGARGAAHIGVLKVLEEAQVPIDCIAGTSFGAIIGGLYASGAEPDALEAMLARIDWDAVLDNTAPRRARTFRRKEDDKDFLVPFKMGVHDGALTPPPGLILGGNFGQLIRDLAETVERHEDFDRLPIPFRAVAADLATGDEVVLRDGNLADALIASMSVPGLFPPVQRGETLLVDGGIANNVPVSVARALCADIVIVVDVSEPPLTALETSSFADVLGQMISIMTTRNARAQLTSLDPARDIVIRPSLDDLGFADFKRAGEAIPAGTAAANAQLERLRSLSLDAFDWRAWRIAHRPRIEALEPVITTIKIAHDSVLDEALLRDMLALDVGKPLDRAALREGIARIYGLDYFDSVDYAIDSKDDGTAALLVTARQRDWGPDYVRFGVGIEDNFEGDAYYRLALSYTDLGLNRLGGEWRSRLQIGDNLLLSSELYQPLDPRQRYFAALAVEGARRNLFLREGKALVGLFRVAEFNTLLRAGRIFGNWGALSAGLRYRYADVDPRLEGATPDPGGAGESDAFVLFEVDTLDNLNFPTQGLSLTANYLVQLNEGSALNTGALEVSFVGARPLAGGRLLYTGEFATNLSDAEELQNFFGLGGFFNMSGFSRDALFGPHLTRAGLAYYRRLSQERSPLTDMPFYIGASFEAGNAWNDLADFRFGNLIYGGSIFLGAESFLGPIYLGGGINSAGSRNLFLFIGGVF